MRLRPAAIGAVVACLLPALVACGSTDDPIAAGDVVPARRDKQFLDAKKVTVATPIGTLIIHTGEPLKQIPADDTADLESQVAPAGTAFLPITWSLNSRKVRPYAKFLETAQFPTADIRSDGHSYRLPTPDPADGTESFYVLVKGSGESPEMLVGFDGVDQSVDLKSGHRETGDARSLYDLAYRRPSTRSCPAAPTAFGPGTIAAQECTVSEPALLPYAGGAWAEPGHEWLVVSVTTSLTSISQGESLSAIGTYYTDSVQTTYRLNGRKPVKIIPANDDASICPQDRTGRCGTSAALVFEVQGKPKTLSVKQEFSGFLARSLGNYDGRDTETFTQTLKIPISLPR